MTENYGRHIPPSEFDSALITLEFNRGESDLTRTIDALLHSSPDVRPENHQIATNDLRKILEGGPVTLHAHMVLDHVRIVLAVERRMRQGTNAGIDELAFHASEDRLHSVFGKDTGVLVLLGRAAYTYLNNTDRYQSTDGYDQSAKALGEESRGSRRTLSQPGSGRSYHERTSENVPAFLYFQHLAFGQMLKLLMVRAQYTQTSLGEAMGYKGDGVHTSVGRWMNGVRIPPIDMLREAVRVLRIEDSLANLLYTKYAELTNADRIEVVQNEAEFDPNDPLYYFKDLSEGQLQAILYLLTGAKNELVAERIDSISETKLSRFHTHVNSDRATAEALYSFFSSGEFGLPFNLQPLVDLWWDKMTQSRKLSEGGKRWS